MLETLTEIKSGVGLAIVSNSGSCERILTVKELTTHPGTNKIAGMRSIPMETLEVGETHLDALQRSLVEEVVVHGDLDLTNARFLGRYEIRQGVVLHAYLLTLNECPPISPGTFIEEVGDPEWTLVDEIIYIPPNGRFFRPGVVEVVQSYRRFVERPDMYVPPLIRYHLIASNTLKNSDE